MLKVQFKFFKDISYWTNERGEGSTIDGGRDNRRWSTDVSHMNEIKHIDNIEQIEEAFKTILDENCLPNDYFAIMDNGRLSFNTIENGDGYTVDDSEQNRIEADGGQLYICDYDVMIEVFTAFEPTIEQLKTLFPKAEQMA